MIEIKAVIIEDEKNARESLISLLEIYCPNVRVVGSAGSVQSGIEAIRKFNPSVVFLDIKLGNETSFEILERFQSINFSVIFTTAYNNFAIQAFRSNALDYLLKPIEPKSLKEAVGKIQNIRSNVHINTQIANLLNSLDQKQPRRIAVKTQAEGVTFIELDEITFIKGSGNYSVFHFKNGKSLTSSKNIGHYESILPSGLFFRVHQSYIVNLKPVCRILPSENKVELNNGDFITISHDKKDELIRRIISF